MKFKTFFLNIIISLLVALVSQKSSAQVGGEDLIIPRTNSKAVIQQTIASTRIEIAYSRPNRRGRKIFGNLVPFGKVWRTGADEATKITFNTPINLEGNPLDPGTYELFTIPSETMWEVILQKNQNQWGSYKYNPENDVVKFYATPIEISNTIETFTISIDSVGPDHGVLTISWENIVVPIGIKIDLKRTVIPPLEKALEEQSNPPYFQAAMFYYENNIDINRAAELMSLALERNPEHIGMLYRYALILKEKGDIPGAIKASEKSLKGAQNAGPELKIEYMRLNSILLSELKSMKK
ncbi:MAG: DUF2911 domain-containing protein [Allomuricauda sp.]